MSFDTYTAALRHILLRAQEDPADPDTGLEELAGDHLVTAWRELWTRYPILELLSSAPGSGISTDDLTTLTVTIAAAGTSVAGTLSSSVTANLLNRKLKPSGATWAARITAHGGSTAAITLDAVPAAIAAGTACVIYQDEYDLASDFGAFVDGIWWDDGKFIECKTPEWLSLHYPEPADGAEVPSAVARVGATRIRFSHYPNAVRRYQYHYLTELADPSGTATVALPKPWRTAWGLKALSELLEDKFDRRDPRVDARAERALQAAIAYENRRWGGIGVLSRSASGRGAYGN